MLLRMVACGDGWSLFKSSQYRVAAGTPCTRQLCCSCTLEPPAHSQAPLPERTLLGIRTQHLKIFESSDSKADIGFALVEDAHPEQRK